ncbi:hypothetical protein [Deinococcus ficus]|uniref:hypothetical protein n=1 Tax=Deinococcus ficus TaxID=317577 RepID=UPI00174CB5FF|nr:hypothetical protein [Deinococcus ficus]
MQLAGEERGVYYDQPASHLWLEAACREECEARNLAWTVGRWMVMGPPYAATVTGALDHYEQYGASPAEALLLALLEAIEAGE